MDSFSLTKNFSKIHNSIYANDGLTKEEALNEFTKLIFLKIYVEKNQLDTLSNTNIHNYYDKCKNHYKQIFNSDDKINLSENTLLDILKILNLITFSSLKSDIKGLAFQNFLKEQKSDRGQYFTPNIVIKMIINMIKKYFKLEQKFVALDTAAGSGGFLYEVKNTFKNAQCNGIEINNKIARFGKMRFALEDTDYNVIVSDTLKNDFDIKADLIITNPPFGTQGKITNETILSNYELGYKWKNSKKTDLLLNNQSPEVLFIEKNINLLNENGILAIVLPNGIFENSTSDYIRDYLFTKGEIASVIELPNGAFIPYGTGVKTSILFFQKTNKIDFNKNVFFGLPQKLGYTCSKDPNILYKKDENGLDILTDGNKIVDEDLIEISELFLKNETNENSFYKPLSVLKNADRINVQYMNPQITYWKNNYKNIEKLSNICFIENKKSKKLKTNEILKYIEIGNIATKYNEIVGYSEDYAYNLSSRASYEIHTGDIITAVAGNAIGTTKHTTAYVDEFYDGSICTNGLRVMRNFKLPIEYMLYFFNSNSFLSQIFKYRTGSAIPSINDKDFYNILVPLPEKDIIKEIETIQKNVLEHKEKLRKEKNILEMIEL